MQKTENQEVGNLGDPYLQERREAKEGSKPRSWSVSFAESAEEQIQKIEKIT